MKDLKGKEVIVKGDKAEIWDWDSGTVQKAIVIYPYLGAKPRTAYRHNGTRSRRGREREARDRWWLRVWLIRLGLACTVVVPVAVCVLELLIAANGGPK